MQEGSWLPYNHHSNPERTNIQLFLSTMIFFSNKHLIYFSEIDFMIKSYSKKLRRFDKLPLVNQQCVGYHFKCDLCDADYKQLLDEVFVISGIIKVVVSVISQSQRLRLITLTSTLIVSDITKTESNNCFIIHCFEENNDKRIIAAITVYFQTLKNVQRIEEPFLLRCLRT